jgi:hypothetical protein
MRPWWQLALLNAVFAAGLVAAVFLFAVWVEAYFPGAGRGVADAIGLALPGLLALWLLFLGGRYASGRAVVIACAVFAGLLVLAQCALLGLLLALSKGFGGRTYYTPLFELLLVVVPIIGIALIWRFIRVKLAPRSPE